MLPRWRRDRGAERLGAASPPLDGALFADLALLVLRARGLDELWPALSGFVADRLGFEAVVILQGGDGGVPQICHRRGLGPDVHFDPVSPGAIAPPGGHPELGAGVLLALGGPSQAPWSLGLWRESRRAIDDATRALLATLANVVAAAVDRLRLEDELRLSRQHLDDSQALAHMGNYDWDIASDTNVWSDELYRIYGYEPQAFNASYERFLACVHPEDRERIMAVHHEAYEKASSYSMRERIVRPDGEVRTLLTTGEVVAGPDGSPARMRGICLDITERELAQDDARRTVDQLWELMEVLPVPVLAVAEDGRVARANPMALSLFGPADGGVLGESLEDLVPDTGLPEGVGTTVTARAITGSGPKPVRVLAVRVDTASGRLAVACLEPLEDEAAVPAQRAAALRPRSAR